MKTGVSKLKKRQISIIGCGWLGFPLAQMLVSKNYKVRSSTTTTSKLEKLENHGINAFLVTLEEYRISETISGFLEGSETLIINIPPGLRKNPNKSHVQEIKNLISFVEKSSIKNVLYISSTSVFEDTFSFSKITDVSKPNATSNSGSQLIEIENILKDNQNFSTTVLRFSGLFDKDRHPGKILSGKTNISNPDAPINLIHKNDCIAIITKIIECDLWNEDFNASFPNHPIKKEYYKQYCNEHNLELPEFDETKPSKGKIIETSRLVQLLAYGYKNDL
ncbi:MAG: NAD(P)H-binding protein [Winogradskyella sp.]|uniref:NAD(P)-binding domain-containing protein n=1 Tax=Winogradskyella sp. TaxID=1883156 RepID=UPI00178EF966|nr:NAD(P)-binding domain-containing protein [Winogradskyella sp.]MBT8245244.1 NAD(P)H-binding protein [Winogradskyella sp.]NNK23033.1 NAD(P)H-binding protein [Winogradskyella sp.]